MKKINQASWILLIASILFTIAISFLMLIKAAYHFLISIVTDSLVDWLLYGVGGSILLVIIVALLSDKKESNENKN